MLDRARAWDARVETASCFMLRDISARGWGRRREGSKSYRLRQCLYVALRVRASES